MGEIYFNGEIFYYKKDYEDFQIYNFDKLRILNTMNTGIKLTQYNEENNEKKPENFMLVTATDSENLN